MVRITERLQTPAKADATLTLSFEQRQKSRQRVRLDSGEEAGLCLPHGTMLRAGDRLGSEDGRVVEVRALAEPVTAIASYRKALAKDSSFVDAHYNLALLYETAGKHQEALRHLNACRKLEKI